MSYQVHLYRYSTYATVFVPTYFCVSVPAINTGVCMCVLGNGGWDKARRAGEPPSHFALGGGLARGSPAGVGQAVLGVTLWGDG